MDREIVNNIKSLGIDMIDCANNGHPGIVLGAANIIYTLYAKHMNVNVEDPTWENRDRFVFHINLICSEACLIIIMSASPALFKPPSYSETESSGKSAGNFLRRVCLPNCGLERPTGLPTDRG